MAHNPLNPFSGFDSFGSLDNPFGLPPAPAPVVVRSAQAAAPQPAAPVEPYDPTLLEQIGGGALSTLAYVAGVFDKPGRIVRGALGGNAREALGNFVPFSDTLGVTDPEQNVSGRDLLTQYGVTEPNDPNNWEWGDFAGFGAELALDPLNYATFGTKGALTAAGKQAAKVGPAVQRGRALAEQSVEGFLDVAKGSDDAAKAAQKALQEFGEPALARESFLNTAPETLAPTLGGRIRDGQASMLELSVPFTGWSKSYGVGEDAAKFADDWIDAPLEYMGNLAPVRKLRSALDYSAKGAQQSDVQKVMTEYVTTAEDAIKGDLQGGLHDIAKLAKEGNLNAAEYKAFHRLVGQAGEDMGDFKTAPTFDKWTDAAKFSDPAKADEYYRRALAVGTRLRQGHRDFIEKAQDVGVKVDDLTDSQVAYLPRDPAAKPVKILDQMKRAVSSFRTPLNQQRKAPLRDIPGGKATVNDMAMDPQLAGPAKLELPEAEAYIAERYLNANAMENAAPEAQQAIATKAKQLAGYLGDRAELAPIYAEDDITSFASRIPEMARARAMGEGAMELLKRHAVHDPDGVSDGVPVSKLLEEIGGNDWTKRYAPADSLYTDVPGGARKAGDVLEQKGSTSRAAAILREKFGDGDVDPTKYVVPREIATEMGRVLKAYSTPDEVTELGKAFDTATNLYRAYLTQPFTAFAGRNVMDGLSRMWLSTGAWPHEMLRALWRARTMMAGGNDPAGKLNYDDLNRTLVKADVFSGGGTQPSQENVAAFGRGNLPTSVTNDPNTPIPPMPTRRVPQAGVEPSVVEPPRLEGPSASTIEPEPPVAPPPSADEAADWQQAIDDAAQEQIAKLPDGDRALLERLASGEDFPTATRGMSPQESLAAAGRLKQAGAIDYTAVTAPIVDPQELEGLAALALRSPEEYAVKLAEMGAAKRRAVAEYVAPRSLPTGSGRLAGRLTDAAELGGWKTAAGRGKQTGDRLPDFPEMPSEAKLRKLAAKEFRGDPEGLREWVSEQTGLFGRAEQIVRSGFDAGLPDAEIISRLETNGLDATVDWATGWLAASRARLEAAKPKRPDWQVAAERGYDTRVSPQNTLPGGVIAPADVARIEPITDVRVLVQPRPYQPKPKPSKSRALVPVKQSAPPPSDSGLPLEPGVPMVPPAPAEAAARPRIPLEAEGFWPMLGREYLWDDRKANGGWSSGKTWADTADMYNPMNVAGVGGRTDTGNVLMAGAQRRNAAADNWLRSAHAILLKEQGWDDSAIATELRKWHFDYSRLTPTERTVMRRLFPFWNFSSKNAPMVLQELLENPTKYATPLRATTIGGRDDGSYKPDYIGETLAVPLGQDTEGNDKYLTALGLGSLEEPFSRVALGSNRLPDIGRTVERHALNMHPFIRMGWEAISGDQLLTGRPLDSLQPNPLIDAMTDDPSTASWWSRAVANSPVSRFASTAAKVTDDRKTIGDKVLNLITGAKISSVDSDAALERDVETALKEQLQASGHIRESQNYYVPESMKEFLTPEEQRLLDLQKQVRARRSKQAKARKAEAEKETKG